LIVEALVLFGAFMLVEETWLAGLSEPVDLLIHDRVLRYAPVAQREPAVAIIVIDDEALNRLGWPVPDRQLAAAIKSAGNAGARAIGIDLYRDKPVPPGSDELKNTLTNTNGVIGVMRLATTEGPAVDAPEVLRNRPGAAGLADMPVDPDGVVRRMLLYASDGSQVLPGFALAVAQTHLARDEIKPEPAPEDPTSMKLGAAVLSRLVSKEGPYSNIDTGGYQRLIAYRTTPTAIPRVRLLDLLDGSVELSVLAGKAVLIGTISGTVTDRVKLPVGGHEERSLTAGVVLQAIATDELIAVATGEATGARPLPHSWVHAATAMIALVLVILSAALPVAVSFAGAVSAVIIATGAMTTALIASRIYLPPMPPIAMAILGASAIGFVRYAWLRSEQRALLGLFRVHVSSKVANAIWRGRDSLGAANGILSQHLFVTVMFVDVSDSTLVADSMPPDQFAAWIGEFHTAAGALALDHDAFIDKFLGDGMMLVFGAPLVSGTEAHRADDARRALDCAIAIRAQLSDINAQHARAGLPPIYVRIGIHSGPAQAATVGPPQRLQYTVMGQTPAVAARLEALAKTLGDDDGLQPARILLTAATADLVGRPKGLHPLGHHTLKGMAEKVEVLKLVSSL
jgi:adenylate cyclase